VLNAQLEAAKSATQQIALINKDLGTQITEEAPHQATNPSSAALQTVEATLPVSELPELAAQAVDFKECQNQVGVDKLQIAGDEAQRRFQVGSFLEGYREGWNWCCCWDGYRLRNS